MDDQWYGMYNLLHHAIIGHFLKSSIGELHVKTVDESTLI